MRSQLSLAICLCLGLTAGVNAQSTNNLSAQTAAGQGGSVYDILDRLDTLQSEVQQLRGMVEEQSQTIQDLQRKQNNMYADLDNRVQSLTPATPAAPAVAQPVVVAGAQAVVAPPPVPTPTTAGAVTPPASLPIITPGAGGTTTVPGMPVNAARGDEKERYQQAYDNLRNGRNEQSVRMFESLLTDFPNGEYADNAQYWLGEAYKVNRETDKAKQAFAKVISKYPNSAKVSDALLKLGYIESEQQNYPKAREYFNRVVTSFPESAAGRLAAKKLEQLPQ